MKKYITFFVMAVAMNAISMAQVPNGDMEDWTTMSPGIEQPTSWVSSNIFALFGGDSASCFKVTDRSGGSFACKLVSVNSTTFGGIMPGFVATQYAIASRPMSLRLMYKSYFPSADSAFVNVTLFNGPTSDTANIIGSGELIITGNQSSYTAGLVPIDYTSSATPDTAVIELLAGGGNVLGSTLFIDDVKFSSNPVSLSFMPMGASVSVYPNPVSEALHIDVKQPSDQLFVSVTDMTGKEVLYSKLTAMANAISITDLKAGIYSYHLYDMQNSMESAGKFSVIKQ